MGCRVIVPFGRSKYYTAIVSRIHTEKPEGYVVKPVLEQIDTAPILLPTQLKLWEWMADYYLCSLGDVYKAALPSGLKLESDVRKSSVASSQRKRCGCALPLSIRVRKRFIHSLTNWPKRPSDWIC